MNNLDEVVRHLGQGGVIAYPTETIWGLGCNWDKPKAVKRIFEIKGRPPEKAVSVLVSGPDMAARYVVLDPSTTILLETLWPGPVTFVLPALPGAPEFIHGGTQFVGLRCSPHPTVRDLIWSNQIPITTTSINRSGEPPARQRQQIDWLPSDVMIVEEPAAASTNSSGQGSTVIRIDKHTYEILRHGDQDKDILLAALDMLGFLPRPIHSQRQL